MGVEGNSTIRFKAWGTTYTKMHPRGDLFCKVVIDRHPDWERNGSDLHKTVSVNALEMILGTQGTQ